MTIISILAVLPDYKGLPEIFSVSDLINHAAAFTVLYLLLERSYPYLQSRHIFSWLTGYAVLIELVQAFLPTRFADFTDIVADMVGMLIALTLLPLLKKCPLFRCCYPDASSSAEM